MYCLHLAAGTGEQGIYPREPRMAEQLPSFSEARFVPIRQGVEGFAAIDSEQFAPAENYTPGICFSPFDIT
jgi:hypothetical protein